MDPGSCMMPSEDTFSAALSVALQHPAVAASRKNICKLVQVCKAWRTTVQQSEACLTDIKITVYPPSKTDQPAIAAAVTRVTDKLVHVARWLSLYPGTVRSISINCHLDEVDPKLKHIKALAQHVLVQHLRAASAMRDTGPATASHSAAATTLAAGAVALRPLRLQAFCCSNFLASPAILSAIPAATLTELHVLLPKTATIHWRKALSSLSSLRSLSLESKHSVTAYFSSVNKLSQVTELSLRSPLHPDCLACLPKQLRTLRLQYLGTDEVSLDSAHLTQLEELHTCLDGPEIVSADLPSQLQRLYLSQHIFEDPVITVLDIAAMQHLQHLAIAPTADAPEDLLQLKQLKRLQTLDLLYTSAPHAVAAALVWPQLQQLVTLDLMYTGTALQMAAAMDGVRPLTNLTKLELSFTLTEVDDDALLQANADAFFELSGICSYLKNLEKLKMLIIELDELDWDMNGHCEDLLHLSNATGLEHLDLRMGRTIDSAMASAALLELTQLTSLSLDSMADIYALPVIGKLRRLTSLWICGLPKRAQQSGLRFLTQLRNLRTLVGFGKCSKVDRQQFWASLGA